MFHVFMFHSRLELRMTDPVIQALQEQVTCYQRLVKLAELQHEHVQQSQTEALLDVLQRRQEVLDQIARFEQTIAAARKRWGEYLSSLRSDQRSAAERLM